MNKRKILKHIYLTNKLAKQSEEIKSKIDELNQELKSIQDKWLEVTKQADSLKISEDDFNQQKKTFVLQVKNLQKQLDKLNKKNTKINLKIKDSLIDIFA